jgi:protein-tyrosine phosphatase
VADSVEQSILEKFDESNEFINAAVAAQENVFVHWYRHYLFTSFAGKSRSSSFIIAYLIKHRQMTLVDALELLKSKRPIV